jgi:hypothetical protein
MPDLISELDAYRAEQARYVREGKKDRAAAAAAERERVAAAIGVEADKLDAKARGHVDNGQDVLAAQAMVEARRLRAALKDQGAPETAAESAPRETAVNRKGRS